MSGQSWSRREAPWGARMGYTGGRMSDISKVGPGMRKVAVTDKNRPKAAAADIERERAALAGQSLAEYRASRGGQSVGPRSTREAYAEADGRPQTTYQERKRRREASMWFYVDESGKEQGPFAKAEMVDWCRAGQLPPDTMVKKGADSVLRPIKDYNDLTGQPRPEKLAKQVHSGFKLYVGGVGEECAEGELRAIFETHGVVLDVWLPTDGRSGRGRNFGFVLFEQEAAATAAIKAADGSEFKGRKLRVNLARSPGERGGVLSLESTEGAQGEGALYAGGLPSDATERSWVAQVDKFSGRTYYWNVLTDEKTWQAPAFVVAQLSVAAAAAKSAGEKRAKEEALSGLAAYESSDDD